MKAAEARVSHGGELSGFDYGSGPRSDILCSARIADAVARLFRALLVIFACLHSSFPLWRRSISLAKSSIGPI
jgi:hypothetical protein